MLPFPWELTQYEALEAPGVAVLFFHNHYEEGKQGGFEILQEMERVAGNGNLRLSTAPGQWALLPKVGPRKMLSGGAMEVDCVYLLEGGDELAYTVRLAPEQNRLRLTVDLHSPAPVGIQAGFNLELVPNTYFGKAFLMDGAGGLFSRSFASPFSAPGKVMPLASGRHFVAAPEITGARLEIETLSGRFDLIDGRAEADNGWFVLRSPIAVGQTGRVVEWLISPAVQPGWMRSPVVLFSQVGYHPAQRKVAVIELDARADSLGEARLVRLVESGVQTVLAKKLDKTNQYLCFRYAQFDFSAVREPGLYRVEYGDACTEAFPIRADVYHTGVWQPVMEDYFPVQMCHMEVRHGWRVWHGLCHMDDALQAPLNHVHFDGYVQYEQTESGYQPYEHIPYLDRGGWHDAGDYDLAAGSQAGTTLALALAREEFGMPDDQTTVDPVGLKVEMHVPDGQPDVLQQIAHGVENLLSGYRAAGHSFIGIIENKIPQYAFLGDPLAMTNNRVDPQAESDDRWVFTNRHTTLEYHVCAALASAARTLRGWNDALAGEALDWARKAWAYEQAREPQTRRNCYIGGRPELAAARAAVELFLSTGEEEYRQAVLARSELFFSNPGVLAASAARAAGKLNEAAFTAGLRASVAEYMSRVNADAASNPFGVPYTAETWQKRASTWGVAWPLLSEAVNLYYLRRAFPDLVDRDLVSNILGYVLGCHPVSNVSLVSGVGAHSLTEAYGINRADWSFIAGGVVSGPALIQPNYLELLDPFPLLWMQKEYVMGGAAHYVFVAQAADALLSDSGER